MTTPLSSDPCVMCYDAVFSGWEEMNRVVHVPQENHKNTEYSTFTNGNSQMNKQKQEIQTVIARRLRKKPVIIMHYTFIVYLNGYSASDFSELFTEQ